MAPDTGSGTGSADGPAAPGSDRERAETATAALAQLLATAESFERRATEAEALARALRGDAAAGNERVAHALHDTVAQSLVTAHRFLEAARASLAAGRTDAAASQLESAQAAVLEAIGEVREVIGTVRLPGDAG
jgi:signal transduction histidine kinase